MMEPAPLKEKDILCLGHLQRVFDLLDGLKQVGCKRDTAGNRELFFNDYCKLILLYIWNPLIGSMHQLQEAVELENVAKALGVRRFSSGSFSESVRVFDPQLLLPIIGELAAQMPPPAIDPRLSQVQGIITLVDSTVLTGLARLTRIGLLSTRYNSSKDGAEVHGFRLHMQLELGTFAPCSIVATGARNAGAAREHNVLAAHLQPGRIHVGDGGFDDHDLLDDIHDAASNYVMRTRENAVFDLVEERLLGPEALDANIVRDAIVWLGDGSDKPMNHAVRLIEIKVKPHYRRTRKGTFLRDRILLLTDMTDLPAELVALIYLYRYGIEHFFRIFKQLLGMRHLLSQREEGLEIQTYCTVIVCLLICLISGKKPTLSNRNMIGWYLIGLATQEELLNHLNKEDKTGIKKRAKDELFKKLGF
jgi:hypothetical protein